MIALTWRNVWRQKGRSSLTVSVVAVVVWLTLVYFGMMTATTNGFYQRVTEQSGHIHVRVAGYREKKDLRARLVHDASGVEARIESALPGASVTTVLEVPALLSGESRSRGVLLTGQTPPAWLADRLEAGRWYRPDELDTAVLGRSLASALGAGLGDVVYVYAPGTLGLGAGAYQVVGLLELPDAAMESRVVYLPLPALQEMAAPGAATRFDVFLGTRSLADDAGLPSVREALSSELGSSVSVETWREANPSLASVIELIRPLTSAVAIMFFVMTGFLVLNTVYLGMVERTREYGTILALGASRLRVVALALLESLFLTVTGAAAGLVLGAGTVAALSDGFVYPLVDFESYGLPSVLYPSLSAADVVLTAVFTLATAVLAALWPGVQAARLEPVEAMRFVP